MSRWFRWKFDVTGDLNLSQQVISRSVITSTKKHWSICNWCATTFIMSIALECHIRLGHWNQTSTYWYTGLPNRGCKSTGNFKYEHFNLIECIQNRLNLILVSNFVSRQLFGTMTAKFNWAYWFHGTEKTKDRSVWKQVISLEFSLFGLLELRYRVWFSLSSKWFIN